MRFQIIPAATARYRGSIRRRGLSTIPLPLRMTHLPKFCTKTLFSNLFNKISLDLSSSRTPSPYRRFIALSNKSAQHLKPGTLYRTSLSLSDKIEAEESPHNSSEV
jgi:hypothetical protein